jgi:hypothetical protein
MSPSAADPGASGSRNGFSYQQLESDPGVYVVTFSDNGEQVLVSDSFLTLTVQRNMSEDIQGMALRSYPVMVQQHFDQMMETTFPEQTQTEAAPFEAVESTVEDGTRIRVDQDQLASPYVRITVRDPNGQEDSFSVSRQYVTGVLGQENASGQLLLTAVTSFPFRLPEEVRSAFTAMSREQLTEAVLQIPALQRQEIVRMPRFYREKADEVLKDFSNAVPHKARSRKPIGEADPALVSRPARAGRSAAPIVRRPSKTEPARKPPVTTRDARRPVRPWRVFAVGLAAVAVALGWFFMRRKS